MASPSRSRAPKDRFWKKGRDLRKGGRWKRASSARPLRRECRLYAGSDIRILTNADASLASIRNALDDLTAAVRPGDTVIVALSGHGLKKGDATYFAPVRCDPENVEGTGLPWKEVLAKLEEARKTAKAGWGLADCCRAAPGVRKEITSATRRDLKKGGEEGGNLINCTASSGDISSYE